MKLGTAAAKSKAASKPMAFIGQGYEGARIARRLKGWVAERGTINALLLRGGELLRARARQLCRENPYASSAKEAYIAAAIGAGIKPSSLIEDADKKAKIQKAWKRWTDESDADGLTDFYGQMAIAAGAVFEAGECFVRFRQRRPSDGLSVPLQLQLLESEMLPFYKNEPVAGGNVIREGIEFDPIGRRVAYHFFTAHPGEMYPVLFDAQTVRVPASEVLHLYKPLRPGQIRGQPQITPAMVRLYLLDLYDDAELDRKRVAAMFAGFVTKKARENETPISLEVDDPGLGHNGGPPLDAALAPLEPGTMQVLLEGEDITFSNPSEVGGSYEAFMWRNLLAVCAGMGVPYTAGTGDTSKSNYSSSREQQVEFRRRIDQVQNLVFVFQLCRPVWKRWMETAIIAGAVPISPRDYAKAPADILDVKWIAPKWEWVDPWKDRKAQQLAVQEGWLSRDDAIEAEGDEPEDTDKRIKAAQDREQEMGLTFRPIQERVNVNLAATAIDPDAAVEAADERGRASDGENAPAEPAPGK